MSSCILFLPVRSAHNVSSPQTKALEAVLLSIGYKAAFSEREQVSEELLEKSDAVFLEVIREDDLAYFMGLRNRSQKPVLIYGEDIPRSVQIESLSVGADAFLRLPESPGVLAARVHAFLRRSGVEPFRTRVCKIN